MLKGLLSFFDVKNTVITEEDRILLEEVKKDIPLFDKDTGEAFNWYYCFMDVPIPPFHEKTGKPSHIEHRLIVQHCSFRHSYVETFWNHKNKSVYRGMTVHGGELEKPRYGAKPLIYE